MFLVNSKDTMVFFSNEFVFHVSIIQFLNHVIIVKTKVLLPQAYVTKRKIFRIRTEILKPNIKILQISYLEVSSTIILAIHQGHCQSCPDNNGTMHNAVKHYFLST
jgi:hypothetical protein